MQTKKYWDNHESWQSAELGWEKGKKEAEGQQEVKTLKKLPNIQGISDDTAKNLKWKSFRYMISHDKERKILKHFLKHPLRYTRRYISSLFKKKSFHRDGDFFFYGVEDLEEFEQLVQDQDAIFVVGFSYCHKPFECPSGRFTDECIHDPENPVCRQCFIGKSINALPQHNCVPLAIPTIHYIGEKIFEVVHANPGKRVLFMITACELTLEMFGDWGNMVDIRGIGVRLDGRICNTMRAFELSENGIKPGLTVVLDDTQEKMLKVIKSRRGKE